MLPPSFIRFIPQPSTHGKQKVVRGHPTSTTPLVHQAPLPFFVRIRTGRGWCGARTLMPNKDCELYFVSFLLLICSSLSLPVGSVDFPNIPDERPSFCSFIFKSFFLEPNRVGAFAESGGNAGTLLV